jgi:hypothetical protein
MESQGVAFVGIKDRMSSRMDMQRPTDERLGIQGFITWELFDEFGNLKQSGIEKNIITEVGDRYYGERAANIASPPSQVTGMQLGTGTTAPAKSGTGSALVTLVTASLVAIDGGFPTSALVTGRRRIQWKTTWGAGVATANNIAEVVLVNQATATQTAAPIANTIARALLAPVANKTAADTLSVTWNHDLGT